MAEPDSSLDILQVELGILLYIFQTLLLMSYKCLCGIDNVLWFIIIGSKHSYSGIF